MDQRMDRLIGSFKDIPIVDRDGYQYFVHPLTDGIPCVKARLLRDVSECLEEIMPAPTSYDLMLTAEAMGIPLVSGISAKNGKPFSIVRKKSYNLPGEVRIEQTTGYSRSDMFMDLPEGGGRLVIVDDVISTGGTLKAIARGVKEAGWDAVSAAVIVDKTDGRIEGLERELGFPIKALVEVDVVEGKCVVRPKMGMLQ